MPYASNEGPDQPAHTRSLIWTYVARLQKKSMYGRTEEVMVRLRMHMRRHRHRRGLISSFAARIQAHSHFYVLSDPFLYKYIII